MTDWRQIQARIRRAKGSSDPLGKLAELFKKFRDGMVAFELGTLHEQQGQPGDAAHWYGIAAQRFRRADWKRKAEAALERLGAPVPAAGENGSGQEDLFAEAAPTGRGAAAAGTEGAEAVEPGGAETFPEEPAEAAEPTPPGGKKKRRRGRRGGRRHRKHREKESRPGAGPQLVEAAPASGPETVQRAIEAERRPKAAPRMPPPPREVEPPPSALAELAELRGRSVEPALASRLARLEAQLRRLLAAPLYRVDDTDSAPAGPGVLLLSDSDQVTHYYIEACATIRIALGNLLRAGTGASRGPASRGRKSGPPSRPSGPPLKGRLAEELGISESRVAKYLKDHCTVRWLQLDEGAAHLAHFAIAVLKPRLND